MYFFGRDAIKISLVGDALYLLWLQYGGCVAIDVMVLMCSTQHTHHVQEQGFDFDVLSYNMTHDEHIICTSWLLVHNNQYIMGTFMMFRTLYNTSCAQASQKPELTVPVDFPANIVFPCAFSWMSTIVELFFYQKRKFRLYISEQPTSYIFLTTKVVNQHCISQYVHTSLFFNWLNDSTVLFCAVFIPRAQQRFT